MSLSKDEEIIRRGYKEIPASINPSCELMRTIDEISYFPSITRNFKIKKLTKEIALSNSKSFLTEHFNIHDVLVATPLKEDYPVLRVMKDSPFNIPIVEEEIKSVFSGSVIEFFPDDIKQILFKGIVLGIPYTEQTSVSYVHEVTHIELDSIPGIVSEYYNSEVLSIFLELLYSYSTGENLLRVNESNRILELVNMLEIVLTTSKEERDTLLEGSKYICSTLKALALFINYYYGSSSIKKEILSLVQKVFDGTIRLEELLSKYDITYESSQDEKRLKKYFSRGQGNGI